MDDMNFDPNDIAKIRQLQNFGPMVASNQGPSFDQMPSPLERGLPNAGDVGLIQGPPPPPPVQTRAPAVVGPAQPVADDETAPADVSEDAVSNDDAKESPLKDLMVTKEDLESANRKKKIALAMGMMGDALANGQSAGNFYLGRMNPHRDIQGFTQKMADMANAPIEQKRILLAQELKQPEMDLAMRSADKTSAESNLIGNMMKSDIQNREDLSDAQKTSMLKSIEGKSAAELTAIAKNPIFNDLRDNNKLFQKATLEIEKANLKYDAAKQIAANSANFRQQSLDLRGATGEARAARGVVDDPALSTMTTQARNIDKAKEQMNDPNHPPSWTQMNEIAQDISAALSGKQVSSDFKLKEIKKSSVDQYLGDVRAAALSNPDQPANPETIKFWNDMSNRLGDAYDRQIKARAETLKRAAPDRFQDATARAADQYTNGSWRGEVGIKKQGNTVNMKDPKGNIRAVPNDQVEAAKAAGGVVVP